MHFTNFLSCALDDESHWHVPGTRHMAQAGDLYCAGGGPGNRTTAVATAPPGGT